MTETGWQSLPQILERLSPSERTLGRFITEHRDEIPFLNAADLARDTGVSTASVTRFAQRLGYEGYPHMQREIRAHLRSVFAPKVAPQQGLLEQFWQDEQANLELLTRIPEGELLEAAQRLANARKIWIIAGRVTQYVAQYAWYDLLTYRNNVHFVLSEHNGSVEFALDANDEDVVLVYTIRRYTKATTQLVEIWQKRGCHVILITDDGYPPALRLANQVIRTATRPLSGAASLTSLTSLTHALTMLTAQQCGSERFDQLEEIIQQSEYYEY